MNAVPVVKEVEQVVPQLMPAGELGPPVALAGTGNSVMTPLGVMRAMALIALDQITAVLMGCVLMAVMNRETVLGLGRKRERKQAKGGDPYT